MGRLKQWLKLSKRLFIYSYDLIIKLYVSKAFCNYLYSSTKFTLFFFKNKLEKTLVWKLNE